MLNEEIDAIDLNDCLSELPRLGNLFERWGIRKVNQPVRSPLEPDAWIYGHESGVDTPIAFVYPMPNGGQSYVPLKKSQPAFHEARYLEGQSLDLRPSDPDKANFQPASKIGRLGRPLDVDEKRWLIGVAEGTDPAAKFPDAAHG